MGFMCPGCGCSTCTCVFNFTLVGCNSAHLGAGYPYTITQSGVTLATGTTDAAGSMGSVTVHSTANVTVAVTSIDARLASLTTSFAPACGSTFNVNVQLVPTTGYACPPTCYHGTACAYPIAKTLFLLSPTGNLVTMGFTTAFGSPQWRGSETITAPAGSLCDIAGSGPIVIQWLFPGNVTANVCVLAFYSTCSAVFPTAQGCSTAWPSPATCGATCAGTGTQSSFACYDPALPSSFSAAGTYANTYFSGSWSLTE